MNENIFDRNMDTQEEQENATLDHKFLTFWVDKQLFGIPIADVVQIVGVQEITSVPEFPHYAKGVINLRGSIIPIIDVRIRFNKPETEYNERTCVIVVNINDSFFGFIVDAVDEVTDISDEQIAAPPRFSKETVDHFLTGIGKLNDKVALLIDSKKILSESEFEEILSDVK